MNYSIDIFSTTFVQIKVVLTKANSPLTSNNEITSCDMIEFFNSNSFIARFGYHTFFIKSKDEKEFELSPNILINDETISLINEWILYVIDNTQK